MKTPLTLIFLIILLLWSIYRSSLALPIWIEEFLVKPALWLGPIVFLVDKKRSKKLFSVFLQRNNLGSAILVGGFLGILLSITRIVASREKLGGVSIAPYDLNSRQLSLYFVISLATSITEELVFRGFFLVEIIQRLKSHFFSNFLTSFLFIIIHVPLLLTTFKYSFPDSLSYLAIIGLISYMDGVVYLRYKNLAAPITLHAMWNLFSSIIR